MNTYLRQKNFFIILLFHELVFAIKATGKESLFHSYAKKLIIVLLKMKYFYQMYVCNSEHSLTYKGFIAITFRCRGLIVTS